MRNPFSRFWRLLPILPILTSLYACGKQGKFDVTEIKDYRIFIATDDARLHEEITSLVDQFNVKACAPVLSIVDVETDANSTIGFVDGLMLNGESVIGSARWTRLVDQANDAFGNDKSSVVYRYGMNIDFDLPYVTERLGSDNESHREDLFKLFSHEVGHGMEMRHSEDPSELMFPDIKGTKNIPAFFANVRTYLSNGEHPQWAQAQCGT